MSELHRAFETFEEGITNLIAPYKCPVCHHKWYANLSDPSLKKCPSCGKEEQERFEFKNGHSFFLDSRGYNYGFISICDEALNRKDMRLYKCPNCGKEWEVDLNDCSIQSCPECGFKEKELAEFLVVS
jgi:predicted RNA-binding Zn-ribbon protein involved in translation (DUF1610 family)